MKADVIYCDNHLLVLNKPAGIPTQPAAGHKTSLEDIGKEWLKHKFNKPGNVFLEAVHRIDRPVSGVVLFARTSKALSRLQETIRTRNKDLKKIYLAVTENCPKQQSGKLVDYLKHASHRSLVVSPKNKDGKEAILTYKVKQTVNRLSLIEVELKTGRYHQIRVQFANINCPLAGDKKYGAQQPLNNSAIGLHHYSLTAIHPVTKEIMEFKAPLPDNKFWQTFIVK